MLFAFMSFGKPPKDVGREWQFFHSRSNMSEDVFETDIVLIKRPTTKKLEKQLTPR